MDDKITLPALTQLLALKTGDTKKQSEDFIKEFFSVISDALASNEPVKIKDFGIFKTVSVEARKSINVANGEEHRIPPHRKAVFIPTKELAAYVNQPFEMFETVEVAEGVSLEDSDSTEIEDIGLAEQENTDSTEHGNINSGVKENLGSIEMEGVVTAKREDTHSSCTESGETGVMYELTEDAPIETDETPSQTTNVYASPTDRDLYYNDPDVSSAKEKKHKYRFIVGFAAGFVCAAVISALILFLCPELSTYLSERHYSDSPILSRDSVSRNSVIQTNITEERNPDESDSVISGRAETVSGSVRTATDRQIDAEDEVPTSRSDAPVYDVISKTRYLTTMAKDHYGNYNLWPIIYEENKSILGHPDRIKPGTRVIVPPLSKYGVDPNDKKDIENAKRKGVEIYSRYK